MRPWMIGFVVLFALGGSGCTTECVVTEHPQETPYWQTQHITYDQLMAEAEGNRIRLVLEDSTATQGRLVRATPDSIVWTAPDRGLKMAVPTSQVSSIEFSHDYALEGAVAGFALTIVPLLAAGAWEPTYDGNEHTPQYIGRSITVYLGSAAVVTGLMIGALSHHTSVCRFDRSPAKSQSEADSLK